MNVKFKRSNVYGKVPAPSDMYTGEILLNTTDRKGYIKGSDGVVYCVLKELDDVPNIPLMPMSLYGQMLKGTIVYSNGDGTFTSIQPGYDGQILLITPLGDLQWGNMV